MDDTYDDDGGFVGYVPNTVNPGPVLLVATLACTLFLLAFLPLAVILGDKYEELSALVSPSDDDDVLHGADAQDNSHHSKKEPKNDVKHESHECDASASSKGTYYSAVSATAKMALDAATRPLHSPTFHHRHRHRHLGHVDRNKLVHDPSQYSIDRTHSLVSDDDEKPTATTPWAPSLNEDPPGIKASLSPVPSVYQSQQKSESKGCSFSDCGDAVEITMDREHGFEKPLRDRNTCMTKDSLFDEIADIMAWDAEMKRIIKLSIPFSTQALFLGMLSILTTSVIGKLIGTREVSAFVVVNLLVSLTTKVVGGLQEALCTLCSQAIGASKKRLAGKYVQIAAVLYTIFYIPLATLWGFYLDDAILWFGFDQETATMGQEYGVVLLATYLIEGWSESVHGLLAVAGFENFSTFIVSITELISFICLLIWALVGSPTLLEVGILRFVVETVLFIVNLVVIWWYGWFLPYRSGMIGTFALLDKKAVRMVCKTAASLSFGYLLTDGEWEVLTVFASFLGPAEVAAWGILGVVWDAVNLLIDGISDASEVRCAFLLGSGQPERARLSAHKSLMLCICTSLYTTAILFMCGESLPIWLTNDPTLQHMLKDLIPLFGIGNAAMCVISMSWTLLGSQGRYRLATGIALIASWCFTLPLAAVFSIYLNLNLEGQTAAVVVGYVIAGVIQGYYLFRSDWKALSAAVMEDNDSRASDDSSMQIPPPKNDDMEMSTHSKEGGTDVFLASSEVRESAETEKLPSSSTGDLITDEYDRESLPRPPSRENFDLCQTPSFGSSLIHQPEAAEGAPSLVDPKPQCDDDWQSTRNNDSEAKGLGLHFGPNGVGEWHTKGDGVHVDLHRPFR